MKSNIKKTIVALSIVTLAASSAHATTIFSHTFDGGTGDLNGTAVDDGTGSWVAPAIFDLNGNINSTDVGTGRGTATLAFNPVDGFIYTLETSLGTLTSPNSNWVGFGFAAGTQSSSESNDRFITGGVVGKSWMFNRGSGASGANVAWLGDSSVGGNSGLASDADWSAATNTFGGNLDMRIVLDTTGGTGNWTSTWFVDTGAGFFEVRAATPMLDEAISMVGFTVSDASITGNIESFSLTSAVVPEPSSTALLGLGSLALILRRRR